jgi:hypothetical protein
MRGKARLRSEIAILLTAKLIVLAGLFFAFFSPSHRLNPDRQSVAAHLIGTDKQ